jgi:hypothetical protein
MHALPKAMAKRGHRVMCIAPRYKNYDVRHGRLAGYHHRAADGRW